MEELFLGWEFASLFKQLKGLVKVVFILIDSQFVVREGTSHFEVITLTMPGPLANALTR